MGTCMQGPGSVDFLGIFYLLCPSNEMKMGTQEGHFQQPNTLSFIIYTNIDVLNMWIQHRGMCLSL